MKILAIIPSRYLSTRFPGKPLIDIKGKTMIQRVYEQTAKSTRIHQLIVATDDERIFHHVESFGGKAIMTSVNHATGTDRCNEVMSTIGHEFDFAINVQGDEPFLVPEQIDELCDCMDYTTELATLAKSIEDEATLFDTNEAHVVFDKNHDALYFSRNVIPFQHKKAKELWLKGFPYYKHVGLYAYRKDILQKIASLPQSALELAEGLEQLRWLEAGFKVKIGFTKYESVCIDSPEDLQKINYYELPK